MSIVHCHYCEKPIDLDYNVEHFIDEEFKLCTRQAEDEGRCLSCGRELEEEATDWDNDEVHYYTCPCEMED